jgi:thioester reductase-like protein
VTEAFLIPELDPGRDEWAYHEWNPHYKHEMQPYDPNEQTYELVVLADESNKHTTAIYHNLPGVAEFHTKDLFTRHPQKPNLYKYYGRRDDIIVLANAHKLNPLPMEAALTSHPDVKGAIVIGNRRSHTVLLVEAKDALADVTARKVFLDRLWPSVEKANTLIAGQGRVQLGHVICGVPEKQFARTGKGTIVRKLSEDLYTDEIESLYTSYSSSQEKQQQQQQQPVTISLKPILKPVYELPAVVQFLREVIGLSFLPAATIAEHGDFFGYGLDSMQTLEIVANLRRHLKGVTSESVTWITPRTVFYNSSLKDLSILLSGFLNDGTILVERSDTRTADTIEETVKRHIQSLPEISAQPITESKTPSAVAIIGSTGYLGVHLVAALLQNPDITHIYCLNRASDARQRQEAALLQILSEERVNLQIGKLQYMTVILGEPRLGLTASQHDTLADQVDVIVYNAWKLDFGLSLRSFEPFLRATCDTVELAASGTRTSSIIFVSSLSSVGNLSSAGEPAPEALVEGARAPLDFGYAQSKHAAERILAAAGLRCGTLVSIVRVGQVGGSVSEHGGTWPEQRWISALLRTAKTMGSMPTNVALVDWVPVETVAAVLRALIVRPAQPQQKADVFHIYPSRPPPRWELVVGIMRKTHGITQTLSLPDWTQKLRSMSENATADDVSMVPAVKVLDFYEASGNGLETVRVATERTVSVSGVDVEPVDERLVSRWLHEWNL